MCIFPEKEVTKTLLFIVNLAHEEVKIVKGWTLAYLIPAQNDNFLRCWRDKWRNQNC